MARLINVPKKKIKKAGFSFLLACVLLSVGADFLPPALLIPLKALLEPSEPEDSAEVKP